MSEIESLVRQGLAVGYGPPELAEAVELSWDILAKLQDRAILPATIPPTLIGRLAEVLQVSPAAISTYLARPRGTPLFLCGGAPQRSLPQAPFLAAVRASPLLSAARKGTWQAIIARELQTPGR